MRVPRVVPEVVKALEAGLRALAPSPAREICTKVTVNETPARADEELEKRLEQRALFLSLKPRYANAILNGTKTVELRRTRPTLPTGSLVILYSSAPTRAVVGWAQLIGVRGGTPVEIWNEYGAAAGIEEIDYHAYFHEADRAFALELDDVVAAVQPIPLSVIRSIGVQPPQSWRYLAADVTTQIQASAARS